MEPYIKNNLSDITYMSELTPHPAAKSFPGVFSLLGVGLNSQTLVTVKRGSYNLCRSFGAP